MSGSNKVRVSFVTDNSAASEALVEVLEKTLVMSCNLDDGTMVEFVIDDVKLDSLDG